MTAHTKTELFKIINVYCGQMIDIEEIEISAFEEATLTVEFGDYSKLLSRGDVLPRVCGYASMRRDISNDV